MLEILKYQKHLRSYMAICIRNNKKKEKNQCGLVWGIPF